MHRLIVIPFLAVMSMAVLGGFAPAAPAQAAGISHEECSATGSVTLYTDPSMTTLVDYFTVVDAPTQHLYTSDGSRDNYVIQSAQAAPGVDVTGALTGTMYRFEFRIVSISQDPASGGAIRVAWADWRVTHPGGGIVADARNQQVRIYSKDGPIVIKIFGPTDHGLMLSGGLGIRCPSF